MIKPIDLAHVTLNVTDLERSLKFYTEILSDWPHAYLRAR